MRTFALIFGLLGALLVVLCLRPPASAAETVRVRVFDSHDPARSIIDDRHDWTWTSAERVPREGAPPSGVVGHYAAEPGTGSRPIFDVQGGGSLAKPVLLRRDRASGSVVGHYAPASAKEKGAIGVEWSENRRIVSAAIPFRVESNRGTSMTTYVRPIEERHPIF